MTIEVGTTDSGAATQALSPAGIAFLDAIRKGEGGVPLLRKMLGDTKLSAEQQAFVDVLLDLEDKKEEAEGETGEEDHSADDWQRELTDLREANDTLASALGACPICWGGDRHCEVCRGRGRPGYRVPEPALFNELVVPAIHRVRAMTQDGTSRVRRARV
jgi:hypothetical protein